MFTRFVILSCFQCLCREICYINDMKGLWYYFERCSTLQNVSIASVAVNILIKQTGFELSLKTFRICQSFISMTDASNLPIFVALTFNYVK